MKIQQQARKQLKIWKESLKNNFYEQDHNLKHSLEFYFKDRFREIDKELSLFSKRIFEELEPLANENDLTFNNPRLESYDDIGEKNQRIIQEVNE